MIPGSPVLAMGLGCKAPQIYPIATLFPEQY